VTLIAATVVRFGVPAGVTLEGARDRVRAANPAATADFNHFYRPVQAAANGAAAPCETMSCPQARLVAWPAAPGEGGTCGAGARIGLVDTGINPEHEALAGAALRLVPLELGRAEAASSGRQHGTAVAAILLAAAGSRAPGLLPDAEVFAVDVFFRGGSGGAVDDERTDAFSLVRGLDRVSAEPITALNLSLAGPANEPLRAMVEAIVADGIVVVASVGNSGPQAAPLYPAAYPNVIGVTAVDSGGRAFRRAGRGDHVDLAAPGVEVWTAASISGAKPVTGTSFAAPFVTAAVALAQAGRGASGHDDVLAALAEAARDLGEPGRDPVYGAGLLDAAALCSPPA
jgi:subtilisin family serine protease